MRKAEIKELEKIEEILASAKRALKADGIDQWQQGSPNRDLLIRQIERGSSFVFEDGKILAYAHLSDLDEENYKVLEGKFKGEDFYTIHTVCVATTTSGKGVGSKFMAELIDFSKNKGKDSLRIDTTMIIKRCRVL